MTVDFIAGGAGARRPARHVAAAVANGPAGLPSAAEETFSGLPSGMPAPAAAAEGSSSGVSGFPGAGGGREAEFGALDAPGFLRRAAAAYPYAARRAGRQGVVVLRLLISAAGELLSVEVIEDPGFGLASAAVAAVRHSTFRPATMNGAPAECRAILRFRFVLDLG